MNPRGVTWIIYHLKPHIKNYFDQLIDDGSLSTVTCHSSYAFPTAVTKQRCWPHFGLFFDYLVRRELFVLLKTNAVDNRAELFKSALVDYDDRELSDDGFYEMEELCLEDGVYISTSREYIGKLKTFLNSYEIFKDTIRYETIDILEHIFNTAMLQMMYYKRRTVPYCPEFINLSNITDVLNHVRSWDLTNIQINPKVHGKFFCGDADLIFHDCIVDLKVSKHNPSDKWSTFKEGIYQMFFYALGSYLETSQERSIFKVYNPLLGVEHVLDLHTLDFRKLRLKIDKKPSWVGA